jgi:hypothetical protein
MEFTSLAGTMGRHYAEKEGLSQEVSGELMPLPYAYGRVQLRTVECSKVQFGRAVEIKQGIAPKV